MDFECLLEKLNSILHSLSAEKRQPVFAETMARLRQLSYEFDMIDAHEYAGFCALLAARHNSPGTNLEGYLQDILTAVNYFLAAIDEFSLTGVDNLVGSVGVDVALSSCVPSIYRYPFLKAAFTAQLGRIRQSYNRDLVSVAFEEARDVINTNVMLNSWSVLTQEVIKCYVEAKEYYNALVAVEQLFNKLTKNLNYSNEQLIWCDITRALLFQIVFKYDDARINNKLKRAYDNWKSLESSDHLPKKLALLLKSISKADMNMKDKKIVLLQLLPFLDSTQKLLLNVVMDSVNENLIDPLLIPLN